MNKFTNVCLVIFHLAFWGQGPTSADELSWKIENALIFGANQLDTLAEIGLANSNQFVDYSNPAGEWTTKNSSTWCSGFVPGLFWQMYDHFGDEIWLQRARSWTNGVRSRATASDNDTGFQIMDSFGLGYLITGETSDDYLNVLRTGAETLYTQRYNSNIGCYRAWPGNSGNTTDLPFEVIPDQMMNLELPLFIAVRDGNQNYLNACISHADKTWEYIVRDDNSTFHVASFNLDGTLASHRTHQGWTTNSTWSRGQAWAVYGYTAVYRYTQLPRMLDRAEACFDFFIAATAAQTGDHIPYSDFDAPINASHAKDSSAAAILASAAIELYDITADMKYLTAARNILGSLSGPGYLAEGTAYKSILRRACAKWGDPETAAIFADYYFVEASLRYLELFPLDGAGATAGQLVNISTRGFVGTGENVLIGSVVIDKDAQQILVQAVGQELDGVTGKLVDPVLEIRDPATNDLIASNDNWEDSQAQDISGVWNGSPPLTTGSTSAAILITLEPGSYSAIVSGKNGTTGVALVEIYEID